MSVLSSIFLMLIGIITLMMGAGLYRYWITFNGAILGFLSSIWIIQELGDNSWLGIIIAVIVAVIFAFLAYQYYKVGFAISGALIGAMVIVIVSGYIRPLSDWIVLAAMAAGALIFAVMAIKIMKPYIIVASSFSGSLLLLIGMGYLIGGNITNTILDVDLISPDNVSYPLYYLAVILLLTVVGIIMQSRKYAHLTMDEITK